MAEKYEVQLLGYEDYRKESNKLKIGVGIFEQKIQLKKYIKKENTENNREYANKILASNTRLLRMAKISGYDY